MKQNLISFHQSKLNIKQIYIISIGLLLKKLFVYSYFDRPMQKAEWRVEVRGEDLLPPLTLHHPGHPGGSTPFLAPQPLQGPSKPEPRPLPPAPGPPAPTFRYHWYIAILYYITI